MNEYLIDIYLNNSNLAHKEFKELKRKYNGVGDRDRFWDNKWEDFYFMFIESKEELDTVILNEEFRNLRIYRCLDLEFAKNYNVKCQL